MPRLLQDLYQGKINPLDIQLEEGNPYKKMIEEVSEHEEELLDLLTGKEKVLFAKLTTDHGELKYLSGEEKFIQGFKMGARFIIEILYEHDGKLTDKNR